MHLLQSPLWGAFKSEFGWTAQTNSLPGAGDEQNGQKSLQILYRRLPLGFKIADITKGPAINWQDRLIVQHTLSHLKRVTDKATILFLKIEPDVGYDQILAQQFLAAGFVAGKPVQPVNTIVVDIAGPEETILARMKSKTRYNIRLAQRKDVTVKVGIAADLTTFYDLSRTTAARNGFAIHPLPYYQAVFDHFATDHCALLMAEHQGQPLAGLMVFAWQERAYYLYGASNNQHRNRMPTYLLQWEAIRWAKAKGCQTYDLWGIPDAPLETLEAEFSQRQDGLWGVYRAKRGFGGRVARSLGAFDYVHPRHPHKRVLYTWLTKFLEKRSA